VIDELVAEATPITDDEVRALALEDLEGELCAAIMRAPRAPSHPIATRRRRRPPPSRRIRVAGAIAVAACAALVLAGISLPGADRGAQPAFAAEAVRVANAVPRLLIAGSGWTVQRADQFSVGVGEMTFADGDRHFDLSWNAERDGARADRYANDPSLRPSATTEVAGHHASVYRYAGTADDFAAVWRQDGYVLEFRGAPDAARARTLPEFERLLHALRPASVRDWLSAMPASVVLPVDQDEAVRRMLADIPVPAGFDAGKLASNGAVRDRYQLGARVAGAAACAWVGRWAQARGSGDEAGAARAVAAMRTSRDWAILREMEPLGRFSQEVWTYADAIAGSGTVVGGKVLTVEESYADALGCSSG
jgi:hypothetical protein